MSRIEYEELACPFCDKGIIVCGHLPESYRIQRTITSKGGKSNTKRKSSEVWIIKSGCSVCGKSQEEVERELKRKDII